MFFASTALWLLIETNQGRVVERFPNKEACIAVAQSIRGHNAWNGPGPSLLCKEAVVMK